MSKLEKDISKEIRQCLSTWQFTSEVIWFTRLNSGKIRLGRSWINLCEEGTPDYLALIRGKDKELISLFIEAKSDTGKLSPAQVEFKKKYHNGKDVHVLEIRDSKILSNFINEISVDRLKEIPYEW